MFKILLFYNKYLQYIISKDQILMNIFLILNLDNFFKNY